MIRLSLDLNDPMQELVDTLSAELQKPKGEVVRLGINLLMLVHDAKSRGEKFAIVGKDGQCRNLEIVW